MLWHLHCDAHTGGRVGSHRTIRTLICIFVMELLYVMEASSSQTHARVRRSTYCDTECVYGTCDVRNDVVTCLCSDVYTGSRCERVNMNIIDVITIGNTVIFNWPVQPLLQNFSLVYFRVHDPSNDVTVAKKSLQFLGDETSILVETFEQTLETYRICIEPNNVASHAVVIQTTDVITNCIDVTTQIDYHSLAGWFLSIIFCLTAVLLICCQRDKIELIYFNRPWNINAGYNYNVEELIRNEKLRKEKELGCQQEDPTGNEAQQTTVGNSSLDSIDELRVCQFVRPEFIPKKQRSFDLETIFDDAL